MYNTQLFGHVWPYVEYTEIKYITLPCNVLHYIGLHCITYTYANTHTDTCYQSVPCQTPHC